MGASPREGTSKPAKHPLSNPRLHPLDIGVGEHCPPETHGPIASLVWLEYAVDDTTMEMQMLTEGTPQNSGTADAIPCIIRELQSCCTVVLKSSCLF